ncbi:MAG: transcriptional regulator [Reyranellaceae bacterium]
MPAHEWPPEIVDLNTFGEEFQRETDRGAALVAAALIDHYLADILRAYMISNKAASALLDGGTAPLSTFSSRIDAAYALGLINSYERADAHNIRRIRNEFAHSKHGTTFKGEKISSLCHVLKGYLSKRERTDQRQMFIQATLFLAGNLLYRALSVTAVGLVRHAEQTAKG